MHRSHRALFSALFAAFFILIPLDCQLSDGCIPEDRIDGACEVQIEDRAFHAGTSPDEFFANSAPIQLNPADYLELLRNEPTLLALHGNFTVCGDIHGSLPDLQELFNVVGLPSQLNRFLFLGDYVDRGPDSLAVLHSLLILKTGNPDSVHLLRGNHETRSVSSSYGFFDQVRNETLWEQWNELFDQLPIAAVLNNDAFACHGGIASDSDVVITLDEVAEIPRPIMDGGTPFSLTWNLLWSDFDPGTLRQIRAPVYEPDDARDFLKKNNLSTIIGAHVPVRNGYRDFQDDGVRVLTVFSTSRGVYHRRVGARAACVGISVGPSEGLVRYEPIYF